MRNLLILLVILIMLCPVNNIKKNNIFNDNVKTKNRNINKEFNPSYHDSKKILSFLFLFNNKVIPEPKFKK